MGQAGVSIKDSVGLAQLIGATGYAIVPGAAYRLSVHAERGFARLRDSYPGLPLDRYLTDGGRYRFRRYGVFLISVGSVVAQPSRPYYQSPDINRFAGGIAREFAPLDQSLRRNGFLTGLLRLNVDHLSGPAGGWQVDVHLVRVTASPGTAGQPSPEGPHRDGADYVSIHLIDIGGEPTGGLTELIRAGGTPVASTRLTRPLDSVYIDDRALLHDVTPLVAAAGPAHRDVLLVSYRRSG